MDGNNIDQAGAKAPAFVLQNLRSTDLWQLVRILKRLNIRELAHVVDDKTMRASRFEIPMELTADGFKPLPREKWTSAQRKAEEAAKAANDEIMWAGIGYLVDHIGSCEEDVAKLLAMGTGTTVDDIRFMDAGDYLQLVVQYVTRDNFMDFFTQARSLLDKMGSSQGSTRVVEMLMR